MTVWIVKYSENMFDWDIEKIYQNVEDAISYCEKMNKNLAFPLYSYEDYEVE